ncbi:hypothetical protein TNCV_3808141 [Trichonephila clavipes]|nr:hypothetical protein TNCV_3808141 [Trichonephila clavipes]
MKAEHEEQNYREIKELQKEEPSEKSQEDATGPPIVQTRKSTAFMSYDYVACKKSLECPFGLDAIGKINYLSTISHRQSSSASLWAGNRASKLLPAIGTAYMVPHSKVIPASEECISLRAGSVNAGALIMRHEISLTYRERNSVVLPTPLQAAQNLGSTDRGLRSQSMGQLGLGHNRGFVTL